jgi:4-amino-4-deoxy-L-arabinose transferase-like glycosyltransferase
MGRTRTLPAGRVAVAAAVATGIASLGVTDGLGYDAWSWMVWARELLRGTLSTTGGPGLKPLPMLLAAPLTLVGDAAPLAWLALARISALLAVLLAWRVGNRLAGPVAGWTAALVLAVAPDLGATATYGSSEPLLLLLVLAAADGYLQERQRQAFVLLGVAGLIRPELWPIVVALGLWHVWTGRRLDPVVAASAALPPLIWLGLAWLGTGSPLTQFIDPFATAAPAVRAAHPHHHHARHASGTLAALAHATGAMALPALVIAAVGAAQAVRQRRRDVVLIAAVGVAWVAIVAVMAGLGYPGSRRYFAGPAALFAVVAGVGVAGVLVALAPRRARAAAFTVAAVIAASAVPAVIRTARTVGVAVRQDGDMTKLLAAVTLAGGRDAVLAVGRPAINPWRQTALAWELDTPLAGVQATWHSTVSTPHWHPPAVVFRGPRHREGPPPALPQRWPTRRIGHAGPWEVVRAP